MTQWREGPVGRVESGPPRAREERSDYDAVPEMSSGSRSLYLVRRVVRTRKYEATRGVRAVVSGNRIDHIEAREGGRSIKAD